MSAAGLAPRGRQADSRGRATRPREPDPIVLQAGALEVHVRAAVAVRERPLVDGVAFYLSLYDREIDARLEALFDGSPSGGAPSGGAPSAGTSSARAPSGARLRVVDLRSRVRCLEPTDACLVAGRDGAVVVARGGACVFPLFFRDRGDRVQVTTALPVAGGGPLSVSGLVKAAAAVMLCSSYEPNAWRETPLLEWHRLRRGIVTSLARSAAPHETPLHSGGPPTAQAPAPAYAQVVRSVRDAFERYGASQRDVGTSVVELSGGFDSTLAAAAVLAATRGGAFGCHASDGCTPASDGRTPASDGRTPASDGRMPASHRMRGVSAAFPFYEFRFEEAVQQAVARSLGIGRTVLVGTSLYPYARPIDPVRFDEPAVFVTGIRHAERVGETAASLGATHVYNGHGGDQLFATDLCAPESFAPRQPARGPFSREAWRTMRQARSELLARADLLDRAAATFVYDARQDVWAKTTYGVVLRSPFTDLAVFRAALGWSRYCRSRGMRPDKRVLADALGHWLPPEVVGRRGKVAYDGVWMRAYAANAATIAGAFEHAALVLEHVGLSPSWLIRRTEALAAWQPAGDREVLAAYAIAQWLAAWGIEGRAAVSMLKKKF